MKTYGWQDKIDDYQQRHNLLARIDTSLPFYSGRKKRSDPLIR